MKEIIMAGIGKCGIGINSSYLDLMNSEHDLNAGLSLDFCNELNVHFTETKSQNPKARFLFFDLDPISIDRLYYHRYFNQFNPDNLVAGTGSAMNLYSNGFNQNFHGVIDPMVDSFRRELEKCDSFQAIILNHSTSGGTGSGLTNLFLSKLQDIIDVNQILFNRVIPNKENFTPLEVYNSILTLPMTNEAAMTYLNDNEALLKYNPDFYDEESRHNPWEKPNLAMAKNLSALTSGSRFPGLNQLSLRKILTNISIDYIFKIFSSFYFENHFFDANFVLSSFERMQENQNSFLSIAAKEQERIVTSASFYRGFDIYSSELEELSQKPFKGKIFEHLQFHLVGHTHKSIVQQIQEVSHITQGAHIGHIYKDLKEAYQKLSRKKAFLHIYSSEVISHEEFAEAESRAEDLEAFYLYTWAGSWPNWATPEDEEGDFEEEL